MENKSENVNVENEKERNADDKNDNDDDDNDDSGEAVKGQATDVSKEELAVRIYNTITSTILPQLYKCVTKKVSLYRINCDGNLAAIGNVSLQHLREKTKEAKALGLKTAHVLYL